MSHSVIHGLLLKQQVHLFGLQIAITGTRRIVVQHLLLLLLLLLLLEGLCRGLLMHYLLLLGLLRGSI